MNVQGVGKCRGDNSTRDFYFMNTTLFKSKITVEMGVNTFKVGLEEVCKQIPRLFNAHIQILNKSFNQGLNEI